ncbi:Bro-N domain-containing protein [Riemerella anatipestifer]|nr:Bro-N domain-containing protein [Riemerella anatipestifer]MDY3343753.1 Bro-N domain-containing protein [Riemerella anatipestifer]MDY3356833.1 Bro-N domain-containing protein [Riemerella anatipestifer]
MTSNKNEQILNLQVTDGLAVAVIQNPNYEFVMPVKDVALGYGVSTGTIRKHLSEKQDEFIEGRHYVKGVTFCNTLANVQPHAVYWTKAGIVRLGFFIKSERAKLFRDWAESVILDVITKPVALPPVAKRKHNRLTRERMISILADVAKIEDRALRLSLIEKLGV